MQTSTLFSDSLSEQNTNNYYSNNYNQDINPNLQTSENRLDLQDSHNQPFQNHYIDDGQNDLKGYMQIKDFQENHTEQIHEKQKIRKFLDIEIRQQDNQKEKKYSYVLRGKFNETKQLAKNYGHTMSKQIKFQIHQERYQFSNKQMEAFRCFLNANPSLQRLQNLFYDQNHINIRQCMKQFFLSNKLVKECIKGQMKFNNKRMMIKYISNLNKWSQNNWEIRCWK